MASQLAFAQGDINGCQVFPTNNIWNAPADNLPLDPNSVAYVSTIGPGAFAHADFGSGLWDGGPIGIPFVVVSNSQPLVSVTFDYSDESDPGPYPIPSDAPIEGGSESTGDRHVLVLNQDTCALYELYDAQPQTNGSWYAGSGAIFDLNSQTLRPAGWTSADAAGLPILPGLVRYDEVAAGEIRHAIRFTVPQTRNTYVWPARHEASSLTATKYPPMGQRFRLKSTFDISSFSPDVQVILTALKKYGMILADNGSSWYLSGVPDERWDNDALHEFGQISGSAFEAVDVSSLMVDPNSWPDTSAPWNRHLPQIHHQFSTTTTPASIISASGSRNRMLPPSAANTMSPAAKPPVWSSPFPAPVSPGSLPVAVPTAWRPC